MASPSRRKRRRMRDNTEPAEAAPEVAQPAAPKPQIAPEPKKKKRSIFG